MTTIASDIPAPHTSDDNFSLLRLGNVLLRSRRTILAFAVVGGILGILRGFMKERTYVSSAVFVTESSKETSGLEQAVSQLGLSAPSAGAWGPLAYIELLRSRALLDNIANDTIPVREMAGRRVPLTELLGIPRSDAARRVELASNKIRGMVETSEVRALDGVRLTVRSRWPSVSLELTNRLLSELNRFNIETRQTRAAAERRFAEAQAAEAQKRLRVAEDRMQTFLAQNRGPSNSPYLLFQKDRLQREIALRQQEYTTLLLSGREARLRELRNTPVVSVIEPPRLPLGPESRNLRLRGLLGALGGATLGILFAFITHAIRRARRSESPETHEFFETLEAMTPSALKKFKK